VEHLCRWVRAIGKRIVADIAWDRGRAPALEPIRRPSLGVMATPGRVAAALAWLQTDGSIALTMAADWTGTPVDMEAAGRALAKYAAANRVASVGYAVGTDKDLIRYLGTRAGKALTASELAAAAVRFASTVDSGRLRHARAEAIGLDLPYLTRREAHGTWTAEPVPRAVRYPAAAMAAIRAVYLATEPRKVAGIH
jgi:hypothetical protein